MFRFRQNRAGQQDRSQRLFGLGTLEFELMEIMWSRGQSNVREVADHLSRSLAYTTVMTTLDRLYKKGLLEREKSARAFVYSPILTRQEWERQRAGTLVSDFLTAARQKPSRELLVSSLLDAIEQHDANLLNELEIKIRSRRKELEQRVRLDRKARP